MKSTFLLMIIALTGCTHTRGLVDVLGGAGGAVLGHELSGGNVLATAAGAAGGVLASEGLHYAAKRQSDKAFLAGYDKGRSDAVKSQYWLYVAQQRTAEREGQVRLFTVQLPEQVIDGVHFKASTKALRIEE
jgi:hypothetical protein